MSTQPVTIPRTTVINVWVLDIDLSEGAGVDLSVHQTEREAHHALLDFVTEWWEQDGPADPQPEDSDAAIAQYFAYSDESYTLRRTPLTLAGVL